jgi:hypothetical protein
MKRAILFVLAALALSACAGGYSGPADTSGFSEQSHGRP